MEGVCEAEQEPVSAKSSPEVEKRLSLGSFKLLWDVSCCSGIPGFMSCQQVLWNGLNWGADTSGEGLCAKTSQLAGDWHWRQQKVTICFQDNVDRVGRGSWDDMKLDLMYIFVWI